MTPLKRALIVLARVTALAVSFIAGLVTAIRIERQACLARAGEVQPQVVYGGCENCNWGAFLCWLSGC